MFDCNAKIGQPEAIFFVPVSAEFSEDVVLEVMQHIQKTFGIDELYPIKPFCFFVSFFSSLLFFTLFC